MAFQLERVLKGFCNYRGGKPTVTRQRKRDIRRRQRRQNKVREMKRRLSETNSPRERHRIIKKIRKIAPTAPVPES